MNKLCAQLEAKGVELHTSTPSQAVRKEADGTWTVVCGENGEKEVNGFDEVRIGRLARRADYAIPCRNSLTLSPTEHNRINRWCSRATRTRLPRC